MGKKKCKIKYGEVIFFRDSSNHFFLKLADSGDSYKGINVADYVDAERLNNQIDEIEKRYKPNGLCYELTKKLLENYTFYALVIDRNKSEVKKIRNEIESKKEKEDYSYHITDEIDEQLCINDILYRRSSSRKMLSYFSKLDNLGLAAEGVRLVNKAYNCLMDSKDPELMKEAKLVKYKYMSKRKMDRGKLYEKIDMPKSSFYRLEQKAISDMAFSMFDGAIELTEENSEWAHFFNSLIKIKEQGK